MYGIIYSGGHNGKKDMTVTTGISAYQNNNLLTHKFGDMPQHHVTMEIIDSYFFAIFLICKYENPPTFQ